MEFSELIKNRYSCRKYKDAAIEKHKLDAVLEAGRIAPTGHNDQPQRVLVVSSPEGKANIRQCTTCHYNAPVFLIVCYEKLDSPTEFADSAIVMTHMMLEGYNQGLANVWVRLIDEEKLRRLFMIPENFAVLAIMPIGYAADDARPSKLHTERFPIEHTVFYESYGQGLSLAG